MGLPMFESADELQIWRAIQFEGAEHIADWPSLRHTFSHFHMDITPVHCRLAHPVNAVMEATGQVWYKDGEPPGGLAAPVARLLKQLFEELETEA